MGVGSSGRGKVMGGGRSGRGEEWEGEGNGRGSEWEGGGSGSWKQYNTIHGGKNRCPVYTTDEKVDIVYYSISLMGRGSFCFSLSLSLFTDQGPETGISTSSPTG